MDDRQGEDKDEDDGNEEEEMEESVLYTNLGLCPLAQTNTSISVLHSH